MIFAERGPDAALRLQFEAIAAFSPDEKLNVTALLDALILCHEARRWPSIFAASASESATSLTNTTAKPSKPAKATKPFRSDSPVPDTAKHKKNIQKSTHSLISAKVVKFPRR